MTNFDINKAYVGDTQVDKIYLGTDVVWGGSEPEPDPMLTTPLTFEITSVGTGETGSIGLRLSGDTSYPNKRKLVYFLNHEGTETDGVLELREVASNSAITSLISGLTVGDKIEFWGYRDQGGMSVSESAFEFFVTTAGVTAKVYGNVNSLLFSGDFYYGQPVPQTAETAAYAFYKLFQNKTGFTFGAPDDLQHIALPVPANGLQDSIYREMFYGCTSMTTPPRLPATTLANNCYRYMFYGCTSLTTAPELPATTLAQYCYERMFYSCTRLNYIKCLATNISAFFGLANWVSGVASNGTFVKHPDATWPTGVYGIPTGWAIEDAVIAENNE